MSFFYDTKREANERNRKNDASERRRNTDSNRDGDSQRNRSDRDLFGPEKLEAMRRKRPKMRYVPRGTVAIPSDVNGSYTGKPLKDPHPVQDADDL